MSELHTTAELSATLEAKLEQLDPRWLAERPEIRQWLASQGDTQAYWLPQMSYDDFLRWATKHDLRAEWVNGKAELMTPVSRRHQQLLKFLGQLLDRHIAIHQLGELFYAGFQMCLSNPPRGREPDLLFVAQANLGRVTATYLDGPADLAVEIVSPESSLRDRGEKYHEYEAGGVREYWLIDPQRQEAFFYQLSDEGTYRVAFGGNTGFYTSPLFTGLTLQVEWLWQDPLPNVWAMQP